jgi:retron-type reverse transcriptase
VRRCACSSVIHFSQMCVNSFSFKKVTSLPKVAANQSCGKALGDSRLRLNISMSIQLKTILNMVTIRNLILLVGTSLSYWLPYINNHVAMWLKPCVKGFNQENTGTTLQKEVFKTQGPKFNRLKNRKNLRTTGFNLCNDCYKGKRSVHSTLCIKEGMQANKLFDNYCRLFATKIRSNYLNEQILDMKLNQMIEKCKGKDGRYSNLIQIIGSLSIIKLAYLMVKGNSNISSKEINHFNLNSINLKTLQEISEDIFSGVFKFSLVKCVFISKQGKTDLRSLSVINLREKIVEKAIEIVLTVIFENFFLDCNHGFRINRNCHTALKHLQFKIGNASIYSWAIEGGIKGCFDNISHNMILKRLKQKVSCVNTLILITQILNVNYILNKNLKKVNKKYTKVYKSDKSVSQNTALSSLFGNIVLHELDVFINKMLRLEFNQNDKRKVKLKYCIKRDDYLKKSRNLIDNYRKVFSKNFYDKNFKRLFYVRHADDLVILVAGSLEETKVIRNKVFNYLQSLGLTLNTEKAHIISLKKDKCRFLGISFFIRPNIKNYNFISLMKKNTTNRQKFAPRIVLHAPIFELLIMLKDNGFVKRSSKGEFFSIGKASCISLTHLQILNYFNSRIQGILNYYSCVHNRSELWSIIRFLNYSCALTLARKYKLRSLSKIFKKFGRDLEFKNKIGKKYKIFRPDNLKMLPINEKFKIKTNIDVDKLLSRIWYK